MAASNQPGSEVKRGRKGSDTQIRGRQVSFDVVAPVSATPGPSRRHSVWAGRRRTRAKSVAEQVPLEPTYRMEPRLKFNHERVEIIVRSILENRLTGEGRRSSDAGYPSDADQLTLSLADEIRVRVRDLSYDRYRLVVVVSVGDLAGGGAEIVCASRCLWDPRFDVFCEATAFTSSVYAVAVVFAVYCE